MKNYALPTALAALLLIGAGCAPAPATNTTQTPEPQQAANVEASTDITVSGTYAWVGDALPFGGGQITFTPDKAGASALLSVAGKADVAAHAFSFTNQDQAKTGLGFSGKEWDGKKGMQRCGEFAGKATITIASYQSSNPESDDAPRAQFVSVVEKGSAAAFVDLTPTHKSDCETTLGIFAR